MSEPVSELDPDRMIILSLKPRFAEAILLGAKTVELCRTNPKITVPTRALIYAASPVRALLGTCVVTTVNPGTPTELWGTYGPRSDLDHEEFLQYFTGVEVGTALTLECAERFTRSLALADLRKKSQSFCPPRSYAYVDMRYGNRLLRMAA